MTLALILLKQIIIMFVLVVGGYLLFHFGKISQEGSKSIANILIYCSLPCVIIKGFLVERTPESLKHLLLSTVLAGIAILISILVSYLVFKKDAIAGFATAFANPGFFGIPLIIASLGNEAVFFIAAFIFFTNMGQWTYGVSILTKQKAALKLKNIITAPFMIAILMGLFFYGTGISMPNLMYQCIDFGSNLNTPLAMFTIGIYLAQTDIKKMFSKKILYGVSATRLLIIPLITLGILTLLPASMNDMKLAILIASACPVGSNVAVYAQLHNSDYSYAVETVVISTLLSLITIPLLVTISQFMW